MVGRGGQRKTRSDKKREVKPLVPIHVKEVIYRISHITNKPLKDICELLVVLVMEDKKEIDFIAKTFKRSIDFNDTYYIGRIEALGFRKRLIEPAEHVSIKFKRDAYENISKLAYACDRTPTRITAILLERSLHNIKVVNECVYRNMVSELTDGHIKELRKILSYVNNLDDDNSSWLSILSTIVGDVRPATRKLYELVEEFLRGRN